ncbi:hypothetical protein [Haloferula sp.]|uniref:hypothetical protein n=1 Tax=Haloferula sp. TaxID=2497595 RepID=UPI003C753E5E
MKPLSKLFISAFALVASAVPASSEIILTFSTGQDFLQRGQAALDFRGGDLFVGFRDGGVSFAQCVDDPSPVIVRPYIFCPIGTTGFIASGDFNGDGVRDDLSFYSISQVIPAILVEPFLPDLCQLISAPPSELPRPLGPFVDRGSIIFFNILTVAVRQYNVSIYEFARNYPPGPNGLAQFNREIVYGTYQFVFPRLGDPLRFVPIAVSFTSIPEALNPALNLQVNPFQFTSGIYDANGNYLMDHRLTTEVTWVGNDPSNTSPATDQIRISILDENEDAVLFPPSGGTDPDTGEEGENAAPSLVLDSPLEQRYILPPLLSGFEDPANPENVFGQQAFFRLRFQRFRGTSAIAFDTSTRLFSFKILFVDSYQGYRIASFPTGQPDNITSANADFDGDGQTNVQEYALLGDPTDAAIMYPASVVTPTVDTEGKVSFTMAKRPFGAATYQYRISTDGGERYSTITPNDQVWDIVQNDDTAYVITTKEAADPADFLALPLIREIPIREVSVR